MSSPPAAAAALLREAAAQCEEKLYRLIMPQPAQTTAWTPRLARGCTLSRLQAWAKLEQPTNSFVFIVPNPAKVAAGATLARMTAKYPRLADGLAALREVGPRELEPPSEWRAYSSSQLDALVERTYLGTVILPDVREVAACLAYVSDHLREPLFAF